MLFLLVLGMLGIAALEVPAMAARGQTRELWVFWVVLVLSFGLSLAAVQGWEAPNPTPAIEGALTPLAQLLGLAK